MQFGFFCVQVKKSGVFYFAAQCLRGEEGESENPSDFK